MGEEQEQQEKDEEKETEKDEEGKGGVAGILYCTVSSLVRKNMACQNASIYNF